MAETILRKLSDKISEIYDLSLAKELTDIYVDLTKQIKEDDYNYFNLVKDLAALEIEKERQENIVKVCEKAYDEQGKLLEKIKREKEQIEYDKEYFANFAKELLENRE